MNDIGLRSQARSYSVRLCVSSIHFLCWCFTLCAMFSLKPCLEKNYLAPGFKALRAARCPLAPFQPEVCQRFPSKTKVTWWTRLPPKNPTSGCIYSTAHAQARNVNSNCIRHILTRRLRSSKWKALLFETTLKKMKLLDLYWLSVVWVHFCTWEKKSILLLRLGMKNLTTAHKKFPDVQR